jgi:hypothetical protein
VPASQTWPIAAPLLSDASRRMRIKAVALLAAVRQRVRRRPTVAGPLGGGVITYSVNGVQRLAVATGLVSAGSL